MGCFNNLSLEGFNPDVRTYTTMMAGLLSKGLLIEAKELVEKMEEKGCLVLHTMLFCKDSLREVIMMAQWSIMKKWFIEDSCWMHLLFPFYLIHLLKIRTILLY